MSAQPMEIRSFSGTANPPVERRIARSWSDRPLPLGLDRPFELLGGENLAPDRLPLDLALDWAAELQQLAILSCMRQFHAGLPWFAMPPAALIGPLGAGRTLAARRLARCAGVPFAAIDVSGPGGCARLARMPRSPDVPFVSDPVLAVAASGCANPVILVTGLDKATEATIELVQQLTDPASSSRWTEPHLDTVIDLGQVTWLVQTTGQLGIPRGLAHLAPVQLEIHPQHLRDMRALTILSELLDERDACQEEAARYGPGLLERIRKVPSYAAADGYEAAQKAWSARSGSE